MDASGWLVVPVDTHRGIQYGLIRRVQRLVQSERLMRKGNGFSQARRGPVAKNTGKTRIKMYLDDDIIAAFREKGDELGGGYQTLTNDALRESLSKSGSLVDAKTFRRILREELKKAG